MEAYKQAGKFFTAENEPDSAHQWYEDMIALTSTLNMWGQMGVSWQVDGTKAARLHELEQKVNKELARARADVASLRKGK